MVGCLWPCAERRLHYGILTRLMTAWGSPQNERITPRGSHQRLLQQNLPTAAINDANPGGRPLGRPPVQLNTTFGAAVQHAVRVVKALDHNSKT
jgi:hypothetical protein